MSSFERALLADSGIPFNVAADWFIQVRQPVRLELAKTAGFMDPPDEEGVLEGQFEVPVETAVALMSNAITKAVELQTAATVWSATIRGLGSDLVKRALNSWAHESVAKYLATRASVLAGPVHVKDLEPPPPSTDPHSIAHMMIRGEQELIHALGEICAVIGHNPMHHEIGRFKSEAQGRIDDLWRALDIEPSQPPLPQPPNKLLKHEQAETPQQEAAESPEFEAAEQAAGVEPPEHHAAPAVKAASVRLRRAFRKLAEETGAPMQTEAPMAAPTDSRKLSPINYLAAEQLGRQAQEQGEGAYYRSQAQQAQQAMQSLQQQMEQTGLQLQQFQQQAQMSQQQIQQAQMQAQQAQDEALNQTQAAANMRMGIQKLRAQMMEVASQDPTNVALQEAQAQQQQLAAGGAAPAPDMGAEAGPPQQGPAGGAPGAQPSPGAAPPGGGMPAGGAPPQNAAPSGGADISTAEPQAAAKMSSALSGMLASQASKRLPWALAGAGVGVGDSLLAGASAPGLRKSVAERGAADASGQGGFYNAMMLAVNKARLAHAEFAEKNPQLSAAVHGGVGALIGGTSGPPIGESLGRIANHLKDL